MAAQLRKLYWGNGLGIRPIRVAEVLVDSFSADSVVAGEDDFWDSAASALDQFGGAFRCEGLFPPLYTPRCWAKAMPSR
jgi:hypothetical protein